MAPPTLIAISVAAAAAIANWLRISSSSKVCWFAVARKTNVMLTSGVPKNRFGRLMAPETAAARPVYPVPDFTGLLVRRPRFLSAGGFSEPHLSKGCSARAT
jgi:hypothetical protein